MTRCGVNLFGFDQLLPGGAGRIEATGSGAGHADKPDRAGANRRCVQSSARPTAAGRRAAARPGCGPAQGVPLTGYENERLREAAGGRPVLLRRSTRRCRRARRPGPRAPRRRRWRARRGVGPPPAGDGVGAQADEQGGGHVGAEHRLAALARGRRRAERVADSALGAASGGIVASVTTESPMPTQLTSGWWPPAGRGALDADVRGEDDERRGDQLLGAALRASPSSTAPPAMSHSTTTPAPASIRLSAPKPTSAMEPAVDAGPDGDGGLDDVPAQADPREQARAGDKPLPAGEGDGDHGPGLDCRAHDAEPRLVA